MSEAKTIEFSTGSGMVPWFEVNKTDKGYAGTINDAVVTPFDGKLPKDKSNVKSIQYTLDFQVSERGAQALMVKMLTIIAANRFRNMAKTTRKKDGTISHASISIDSIVKAIESIEKLELRTIIDKHHLVGTNYTVLGKVENQKQVEIDKAAFDKSKAALLHLVNTGIMTQDAYVQAIKML